MYLCLLMCVLLAEAEAGPTVRLVKDSRLSSTLFLFPSLCTRGDHGCYYSGFFFLFYELFIYLLFFKK